MKSGAAPGGHRRAGPRAPPAASEQPGRRRLGQYFEQRIDPGFDRPLAHQIGAERVNRADVGLFELRERGVQPGALRLVVSCGHACVVEPFAQAQLQLAGGLFRECHRNDSADVRFTLGDDAHDAADEGGRLSSTRRGFHDERGVESSGDKLARLEVGQHDGPTRMLTRVPGGLGARVPGGAVLRCRAAFLK